ncbi:MAG: tetratricopeptide repeat protein [Gemmataceae bacterium]|nr:tetratricopeptide repeat protein [Gemmataceae bacterium]
MAMRKFLAAVVVVVAIAAGGFWWWNAGNSPETLLKRGQEFLSQGDVDSARHLSLRLEAGGHREFGWLLEGQILLHERQLDAAIHLLQQVTQDKGLVLQAAALAGRCYLEIGHVVGAESCFQFLLREDPKNTDAHRGLAAVYYDLNAMDQAVFHNMEWARLDDADGRPHRFIGLILKDLGQPATAIVHYEKALQREIALAAREEVRLELTECHLLLNKHAQALEVLDASSGEGRLRLFWLVLRAEALRGLTKYQEAQRLVDEALTIEKLPSPRTLRLQGQLLLDTNRAQDAVSWLQKAVAEDPGDFSGRHLLSQAYARTGQDNLAKDQLRKVEELQKLYTQLTELTHKIITEPRNAAIHLEAAACYRKLGMTALADRFDRNARHLSRWAPSIGP